jgi:hypothetical protein
MANFKSHRPGFLLGWQINAADMMFRGYTDERMVEELWPDKTTPGQKRNCKTRLQKLRKDEKFQEYYRSLVTEWSIHHVGRAYNKLAEQIECDQPWLANKAANDVIQHSKQMLTGMDDGTVVVKVEGMPELGTPDD